MANVCSETSCHPHPQLMGKKVVPSLRPAARLQRDPHTDTRDLDDLISSQSQTKLKKSSRGSSKTSSKSASIPRKQSLLKKQSLDSDGNLSAIGGRDTSLFLFRALGKILYCKRGDPASCEDTAKLPAHLSEHYRDPMTFNPEDVIERSQLSGDFFMSYLHQNYLDFYTELDDVVMAADYFTEADKLTTDWANRNVLCNYAASVAVRGMMFSNSARVSSASLGWKPLHKPHIFEVNKKIRNNKENARYLFRGNSWTSQELHISLIPYLKIIKLPMKGVGQASFIQEMCKFEGKNITRVNSERLDEKDIPMEGNQIDDETDQQHTNEAKDDYIGPVDDDEVVIEDYDD
ncbi:hypothetical protein LSH36_16g04026 [Paralvinella palmiformis]|uniref:Uncharacterized protein n=1 Tax=Paralvinella palmiformis TaxID=53620 RepID=A0AAD9KBY7_9ANNE|nr:hypothetical protein LSH36_16g04026 [Paralvinella palmiformis]